MHETERETLNVNFKILVLIFPRASISIKRIKRIKRIILNKINY